MKRKLEEDVITKEQLEDYVTGEREFDEDDFISQEELDEQDEISGVRYPVYADRDE